MKREEVEHIVRRVFSTVLELRAEPANDVIRAEEPAWNSLKHIELLFALEENFDIQFSETELGNLDRLSVIRERVVHYLEA